MVTGRVMKIISKARRVAGRRYRVSRFGAISRRMNGLNPFTMVQRSLFRMPKDILPTRRFATLTYHEQITMGLNGTTDTESFAANGLYDPYIPAGGHQPRGFDQYIAMYKRYTVVRSRIRVSYGSAIAAASPIIISVRHGRELIGSGLSPYQYCEGDGTMWKVFRGDSVDASVFSNFDAKRDLGIANVMNEADCSGTASANPTNIYYYEISLGTANGTDPASTVVLQVSVEYDVMFSEPNNLATS